MATQMQVYETLWDYVTDETPTIALPVYELSISITPTSQNDQTITVDDVDIINYNLYFSGADLSALFPDWDTMPHVGTASGSLITCDGVLAQIGGSGDYEVRDTTFSAEITTEPDDWATNWHNYCRKITPPSASSSYPYNQYFPVSKKSYNENWAAGWVDGVPVFGTSVYLNDPTDHAKKIGRIFTTKAGGTYGISATGGTLTYTYPDDYKTLNRKGGFAPASGATDPPYQNYPYNATYQNTIFPGCFGSSLTAGQYLGWLQVGDVTQYHNQIFLLVHFTATVDDEEKDFYGYALLDMTEDTGGVPRTVRVAAFSENFWGDSIEPIIPPDPSGPESTTGGGDGSWHWESDDRGGSDGEAFEDIFDDGLRISHHNDIVQNGGINVYQINPQAVADVVGVLYGNDYFSKFVNYMYNPLSAILSYHQIPQIFIKQMKSGGSDLFADLTAGGFNITSHMGTPQQFAVLESLTTAHIGSVDIANVFGAFIDFAPYTQITLHLPYIGDIEIDPNVCMYGTLAVDYACDVMSGNVAAWVNVKDKDGRKTWLYQATGNCSFHVQLFSQTTDGSAVGKIVGGLIGIGAGIAGKNLKIGLEGGVALASGLVSLEGRQTHTSGTMAGNVSCLQDTYCYLHIQRPHWCNPADYQKLKGLPMEVSGTIASLGLKGFIKTARIETDGITATEPEIREIERLLQTGVFYNP